MRQTEHAKGLEANAQKEIPAFRPGDAVEVKVRLIDGTIPFDLRRERLIDGTIPFDFRREMADDDRFNATPPPKKTP